MKTLATVGSLVFGTLLLTAGNPSNSLRIDFAAARVIPVGANPTSFAVADFNRDGGLDVGAGVAAEVSLALAQDRGGFGTAAIHRVGSTPHALAVGDLERLWKFGGVLFSRKRPEGEARGGSMAARPCDRRATKPAGLFRENPSGGGSFAGGLRWLGRYNPLRGCPGLAALAAAKISRRGTPPNFQTSS